MNTETRKLNQIIWTWTPSFRRFIAQNYSYAVADKQWHKKQRIEHPRYDLVEEIHTRCKKNFTYKPDGKQSWRLLDFTTQQTGDCEDFCIGAREEAKRRNVVTRFLIGKLDDTPHVTLQIGDWVSDCNMPLPLSVERFKQLFNVDLMSGYALLSAWEKRAEYDNWNSS